MNLITCMKGKFFRKNKCHDTLSATQVLPIQFSLYVVTCYSIPWSSGNLLEITVLNISKTVSNILQTILVNMSTTHTYNECLILVILLFCFLIWFAYVAQT